MFLRLITPNLSSYLEREHDALSGNFIHCINVRTQAFLIKYTYIDGGCCVGGMPICQNVNNVYVITMLHTYVITMFHQLKPTGTL